jgi:hypothetical protein
MKPISTYYYIYYPLAFCSGSTAPKSIILGMTITFENDNDVIVYTLVEIISYTRDNLYIFLADRVWWISSSIGLEQGLITDVDDLRHQYHLIVSYEGKWEPVAEAQKPYITTERYRD